MGARSFIKLTLLSITFVLASCHAEIKNNRPLVATACSEDSEDEACGFRKLPIENSICSDEVTDALNTITDLNDHSQTQVVAILTDKACGVFNDKIGNNSCFIQDIKNQEVKIVTKDLVKKTCQAAALSLKSADPDTTSATASDDKTSPTTSAPDLNSTKTPSAPRESKKLSNLKSGLSFTLKRTDVIAAVIKHISYVQSGLLVIDVESMDPKKGACHFDGTDFKLELKPGQIFNMSSIVATETELTLVSSDQKLTTVCKKAASLRNLSAEWTMEELQEILADSIEITENK